MLISIPSCQRDVPARYLLRLGQGEQELATDLDFSRQGRVNAMLVRRLELLAEVERLAQSLGLPEDVGYTCESAGYFWLMHVYSRWEQFLAACSTNQDNATFVRDRFPFKEFFTNAPKTVFTGESFERDMRAAKGCFRHLTTMFQELQECRAFELLKSTADRANYLMTKQAKIVAMTCTHAALKRKDFLQLGFKYDNLLMEESAQILEIETFIPMLLQRQEDGYARLKRCILIGDHHQLPPVVKNMAFQKYSHMDQSLFTRFVRLGVPYIELNAQGRARPSIAKLYNWRYRDLGDLPFVREEAMFHRANSGFSYEYQLIDVPDYHGRGESAPSPWFYQNEGEAEYVVSVYMYMRLLGYPANRISILTTYNGQKLLIRDVVNRRCMSNGIGPPSKVLVRNPFLFYLDQMLNFMGPSCFNFTIYIILHYIINTHTHTFMCSKVLALLMEPWIHKLWLSHFDQRFWFCFHIFIYMLYIGLHSWVLVYIFCLNPPWFCFNLATCIFNLLP